MLALLCAPLLVPACAPMRGATRVDETEVLQMEVAPGTVPCQGEALQRCLRVRFGTDSAWTLFYDRIEDFTPEEGSRYHLEVERRVVQRPQADASRFRYRLVRVISRTATR